MTKGRLNLSKHAGLFLALFAFGMPGVGLRDARANVLFGVSSPLGAPAVPATVVTSSTAGLPNLSAGTPVAAAGPAAFTFGGFAFTNPVSSPITTVIGGTGSVSGSTTTPVTTGPSSTTSPSTITKPVTAAPTLDPEPGTIFLFASGLFGVVLIGRRRMRNTNLPA